ncbi:MAG: hypothetical protein Q7R52_04720 [archaeon]|nr:hypothetical protein [archaeon]
MIKNNEPLSMAESLEYINKKEETNQELIEFIKKFTSLNAKEIKEMKEKINALEIIKIKPIHISNIIDILPENSEDLNKIFEDTNLDEDEKNKILGVIKQYI